MLSFLSGGLLVSHVRAAGAGGVFNTVCWGFFLPLQFLDPFPWNLSKEDLLKRRSTFSGSLQMRQMASLHSMR